MAGAAEGKDPSVFATMMGSVAAGMSGRVFCHPLDTAKARLQAQSCTTTTQAVYRSTLDVLKKTYRQEGIAGLYRGFLVTLVGSAPATCLYLTTYEQAKTQLLENSWTNKYPAFVHLSAGMIAETVSCVFFVPIDVVKERLQVQISNTGSSYKGTGDAIRTILRTEGLRGIYKGYGATLASFGPFSGLYFVFYEAFKAKTLQFAGTTSTDDLPFWQLLLCSASAGASASLVTNPLDLVKLRLQIQRRGGISNTAYKGTWDGLRQTLNLEGVPGLFRGAGARMLFHAPSTAITIALFERCTSLAQSFLHEK